MAQSSKGSAATASGGAAGEGTAQTTSDGSPSLLAPPKTTQAMSELDLRASDTAILSHWPTPLLRLLVILSPLVRGAAQMVRLATWTGGSGTASHSFLVLLAWWGICLYGYEVVRFAPQLALLVVLVCTGLARAMQVHTKTVKPEHKPVTANTINTTVEDLSVLADFSSAVWTSIGAPIIALLTWQDASRTLGLAVFALSSWPIWLLLFSGSLGHAWEILGLHAISSKATAASIYAGPWLQYAVVRLDGTLDRLSPHAWAVAKGTAQRAAVFAQAHVLPILRHGYSTVATIVPPSLRTASGPHLGIFPLLSLRVRHLLLILGSIALTWCAPWAALVRHALWRSAFVRHASRTFWSIFSGQIFIGGGTQGSHAYRGRLDEPIDSFGYSDVGALPSQTDKTKGTAAQMGKVSRHEDVVYQFSIFENQRWWMGLDWTAALLPQERPSWADESHNPVSPPSSFSLPPPKVTLTPASPSSESGRYTRRLIRWQWIDADWMVAGRDSTTIGSTLSSGSSAAGTSVNGDSSSVSGTSALSSPSVDDPSWRDVDADGWQYGDNSWEKMSKKAGMGRYTRRRRWVRRAVLTEVVQSDYVPTKEELADVAENPASANGSSAPLGAVIEDAPLDAFGTVKGTSTSLSSSGSLRARLNKAAVTGKETASS